MQNRDEPRMLLDHNVVKQHTWLEGATCTYRQASPH